MGGLGCSTRISQKGDLEEGKGSAVSSWTAAGVGFGLGCGVVGLAWLASLSASGGALTPAGILDLHRVQPLLLFIDGAPLYLAALLRASARVWELQSRESGGVTVLARRHSVSRTHSAESVHSATVAISGAAPIGAAKALEKLPTPLRDLLSHLDMLHSDLEALDQPHLNDTLRLARSQANYAVTLADNIADLEAMRTGSLTVLNESVQVLPVMLEVASIAEGLARAQGNNFSLTLENGKLRACGDSMRLRQILVNLIENSCRYTRDGEIHLSAALDWLDGDEVVTFSVSDTGSGLTADEVGVLTTQVQPAATDRTQLGTGLMVTAALAAQMEASVSFESEPNKGTTVTVAVPSWEAATSLEPMQQNIEQPASPRTILPMEHFMDPETVPPMRSPVAKKSKPPNRRKSKTSELLDEEWGLPGTVGDPKPEPDPPEPLVSIDAPTEKVPVVAKSKPKPTPAPVASKPKPRPKPAPAPAPVASEPKPAKPKLVANPAPTASKPKLQPVSTAPDPSGPAAAPPPVPASPSAGSSVRSKKRRRRTLMKK